MRKNILEALKTKYMGVSEAILDRVAKNLASTVTTAEEVKTAVDGVTFQQILDSYGDSRANDAQKTAVANYEKKHNIKDGKSVTEVPEDKPKEEQQEDMPAWAKQLMTKVNDLSNTVTSIQGKTLTDDRRKQLDEVLKPLSELQRKGYDRISVAEMQDEEFSNLLEEIKGEVVKIEAEGRAKRAVFGKPTVSGSNVQQSGNLTEATKEEVEAVVGRLNIN